MLKPTPFKTCVLLPVSQLTENIVYQMHITLFSVLSTPEIYSSCVASSRYTHPNIDSINQKRRLFKVKVSNTILNIFGVTRATGL